MFQIIPAKKMVFKGVIPEKFLNLGKIFALSPKFSKVEEIEMDLGGYHLN
jgi:hypothetical protein